MQRMFNPPHPGKILRDALGDMDVTAAAKKLHVSRTTLSRILNGAAGISAEMSLRLFRRSWDPRESLVRAADEL